MLITRSIITVSVFLSLELLGCSAEQPADSTEAVSGDAKPSVGPAEAMRRDNTPATMLTIALDGEQRSVQASARLARELDGSVVFSAQASPKNESFSLFSLALAPRNDARLRGTDFALEPGVGQKNVITLLRGELPNATSLSSISGEVKIERFDHETFELSFEAELSRDPRGGGETIKASGTLKGGVYISCTQEAGASSDGAAEAQSGQNQTVTFATSQECRGLLKDLDVY